MLGNTLTINWTYSVFDTRGVSMSLSTLACGSTSCLCRRQWVVVPSTSRPRMKDDFRDNTVPSAARNIVVLVSIMCRVPPSPAS
ncbi:hypothetical protein EXIGLDRAFT_51580 [Exidia glandulosa HHB12029]|uniref:Uncharacterized protein n=1 Tax=Exidia glandulosa HHB12029 TaxID=1314781 RepID=A0A165IF05_EXIGL|nr:hypothetical protein EXIGLDRAFT_51580 [Exidia glandulosa HHB12029]